MTKQKDLDLVEISHQKRIVLGQDNCTIPLYSYSIL